MTFRSSKKNEIEKPFGVGAMYKRSGSVEWDIVELRKKPRRLTHSTVTLVHCTSHVLKVVLVDAFHYRPTSRVVTDG